METTSSADPFASLASLEVEQALIGALLLDNRAFEYVAGIVVAGDFVHGLHGQIFDAISAAVAIGTVASAVTLSLGFADQRAYLATLIAAAPTVIAAPSYARQIAGLARRREIVLAAQDTIADAADMAAVDRDADAVLDAAEERLFKIGERASNGQEPRAIGHILTDAIAAIEEAYRRGGAITVDTGLADLDSMIAGMGAGDLVVLAARPSMGKSCLAGNIAMSAATGGKRVLAFSLEMLKVELAGRWLAALTGIPTDRQRHGKLDGADWQQLADAQSRLARLPIFVDDQARLSVAQMRQRARRIKRRHGLDLIIVDHLQLVRQGGKQENRRLEIGDATSMFKAVAKELAVPVLVLSQLSRGPERRDDKRPVLADLRESGDIEQDADVVMFLYREEYYLERSPPSRRAGQSEASFADDETDWEDRCRQTRGIAEIAVAKNRHGKTGTIRAHFDAERQRFANLARG